MFLLRDTKTGLFLAADLLVGTKLTVFRKDAAVFPHIEHARNIVHMAYTNAKIENRALALKIERV